QVATSTLASNPAMCFDTATLASGVHTLTLTATLTNGKTVTATNPQLHLDNTPPDGELVEPKNYVRRTVGFEGTIPDGHSGPGTWSLEVLAPGSSTWQQVCGPISTPDPSTGRYGCSWSSASGQYPDGEYSIRARMTDQSSDGGNTGYSHQWDGIVVDNTGE